MRVVMSFCEKQLPRTKREQLVPQYRRIVTGPAWGTVRTMFVFELMELRVTTIEGALSLDKLAAGIAKARRALPTSPITAEAAANGHTRDDLANALDSLSTWATVARLQGATDVTWKEDF